MTRTHAFGRCIVLLAAGAGALVAGPTMLKFSHTDQQAGTRHAAAMLFAEKVKAYTQDRYEVRVYPAGQLGNDPKNIEQLQLGGIDFTVSSTGSYAPHIDSLNLTMLPFLVDSYEQGWKLYDTSKWLKAQFDKAPAKGFRFLATWEAGFRCMTTKDPLNSPADAKGKKLRTFPNEMMRWNLEAIGFSVQIMPLPEVYLAIQQGTVAGQENPVDTIYSNKFYEVAPYVTLTRHVYSPIPLAVVGADLAEVLRCRQAGRAQGRPGGRRVQPQGDQGRGREAAGRDDSQGRQGGQPQRGSLPDRREARDRPGLRQVWRGRGLRLPQGRRGGPQGHARQVVVACGRGVIRLRARGPFPLTHRT